MSRPYQQVEYQVQDGVFCVGLIGSLHEDGLDAVSAELGRLMDDDGCRKMVLALGPGDLECLYSVFLAKLINLQRRLEAVGGTVVLAELSSNTREVFRVTGLERHFRFFADRGSAVRALAGVP
jgi:anti-anti-sigma factor